MGKLAGKVAFITRCGARPGAQPCCLACPGVRRHQQRAAVPGLRRRAVRHRRNAPPRRWRHADVVEPETAGQLAHALGVEQCLDRGRNGSGIERVAHDRLHDGAVEEGDQLVGQAGWDPAARPSAAWRSKKARILSV